MSNELMLQQEITLLSLRDDDGKFSGGMFLYAVGGAMLSELLLQGRLQASTDKKQTATVIDESPTGDPILDELLTQIIETKKEYSLQHWVSKAANMTRLKHRLAEQLCDRGILRHDETKIMWLFTQQVYPELDGTYEDAIRARMAKVMFDPSSEPDGHTVVLVALASHAGLLTTNFAPEELRQHKTRIAQLAKGDILASGATQATIEAIQAAILVAVILPAVTVATTSSH